MEIVKTILINTTSIMLALLLVFFLVCLSKNGNKKPGGCGCGGSCGGAAQPAAETGALVYHS